MSTKFSLRQWGSERSHVLLARSAVAQRQRIESTLTQANCQESLRESMREICDPFGTIRSITLFPVQTPKGEAIVGIVDLDSVQAQQAASLDLGLQAFGDSSVVMRVESPPFRMADTAHWDARTGHPAWAALRATRM